MIWAATMDIKQHAIGRRSHARRELLGERWYQAEPNPVSATPAKKIK
jgi:hypothetical protein